MSLNLKVYDNGDHACLVWLPADGKPIANCRGFTVRRLCQGQENYRRKGTIEERWSRQQESATSDWRPSSRLFYRAVHL